jgi:hypothetical protein
MTSDSELWVLKNSTTVCKKSMKASTSNFLFRCVLPLHYSQYFSTCGGMVTTTTHITTTTSWGITFAKQTGFPQMYTLLGSTVVG